MNEQEQEPENAEGVGSTEVFNNNEMAPGDRLKRLRILKGWSQKQLAAQVGVAPTSIVRWERGYAPSNHHLVRLCNVLGISMEALAFNPKEEELYGNQTTPGGRLRRLRKLKGWSRREASDLIGVTDQHFARWERGELIPGIYSLNLICTLFGVSEESLGFIQKELNSDETTPGVQLRRLRILKGWTQTEMAHALSTYAMNISRWERGEAKPGPEFQEKLRILFAESLEELYT